MKEQWVLCYNFEPNEFFLKTGRFPCVALLPNSLAKWPL
jgi:hypothetical protein